MGAYSFAEVISGFTAFYLGAKSVCPSVTMKVQFVGSWSDATLEANAAQALCDQGCVMISQHSDNTTPATAAQGNGVFHTGYNNDMISIAPEASLIGTRIDWSLYFEYAIEAVANGEEFDQDWCHGMDMGAVVMTALNEDIAAAGTAEKLAEVEEAIRNGELQVFDTSTFTVGGQELTTCMALDTDGDFVADSEEAVFDGAFHESYFQSAPTSPSRLTASSGSTRLSNFPAEQLKEGGLPHGRLSLFFAWPAGKSCAPAVKFIIYAGRNICYNAYRIGQMRKAIGN